MHIRRITKRWSNFGRWPRINAALHFDAYCLASLQDSFVSARVLCMLSFRIYRFSSLLHFSSSCFFYRSCSRRSSWFGLQVRYLLTTIDRSSIVSTVIFLRSFRFSNGNSFCAVRSYRRCRIFTSSNEHEVGAKRSRTTKASEIHQKLLK